MEAYLIIFQTITDVEKFKTEYIPRTFPLLLKHSGTPIVADMEPEIVQGNPPNSVAIIKFPSKQAAQDFLNDPDYQAVKEIQSTLTTGSNAVIAAEFDISMLGITIPTS